MSTRTAIVTGASRGFGRATAIALVNAGVHVIGVASLRDGFANLDPTSTRQGPASARKTDGTRNAMKCTHRTFTRGRW